MGRGIIQGGGEKGLYSVQIQVGDEFAPAEMWCADLTEDLAGEVGIMEIAGLRINDGNIQPGYEGNAVYNETRDGQLKPAAAVRAPETYVDWALQGGWQKWMPTYRWGVITDIDYDADTCDVALDPQVNPDTGISVNQSDTLTNVPIEYMECNSKAFETGDAVVVHFEGFKWGSPKVIGFKQEPKACFGYMLVAIGTMCFVWDFRKGEIASDVHINGDPETMAAFPVATSDISEWISSRQSVPFDALFSQEDEPGTLPEGVSGTGSCWSNMHDCDDGSLGGEHGCETSTSGMNSLPNLFGGQNIIEMYGAGSTWTHLRCPEDPYDPSAVYYVWSNSGSVRQRFQKGFRLTFLNGGSGYLDFYKTITYERVDEGGGTNNNPYPDSPVQYDQCLSFSSSSIITRTVEAFSAYSGLVMESGVRTITAGIPGCNTDLEVSSEGEEVTQSINLSYAGYFSEEYKAIAQLFVYKTEDDEYSAYGQADAGLEDVTVAPSGLAERGELSSALKSLAEAVDSHTVSAAFYR